MRKFKTVSRIIETAMVEFYASRSFDELSKIIETLRKNKAPNEILDSITRIRNLKAEKVSKSKIVKEIKLVQSKYLIDFLINTFFKKNNIRQTCPDLTWIEIKRMYFNLVPFMKNPISFEEYSFYTTTIFIEAFQETFRRLKQ